MEEHRNIQDEAVAAEDIHDDTVPDEVEEEC